MPKPAFTTIKDLNGRIDAYFNHIEGSYHFEKKKPIKTDAPEAEVGQKVCYREPEPATMTGLALFIGFSSKQEFDDFEASGRFSKTLTRARLRVEAVYEKKLHQQSSTGAIFALKSMGWSDKSDKTEADILPQNIKIEIIETGPKPASNEKDILI